MAGGEGSLQSTSARPRQEKREALWMPSCELSRRAVVFPSFLCPMQRISAKFHFFLSLFSSLLLLSLFFLFLPLSYFFFLLHFSPSFLLFFFLFLSFFFPS